jgi:hypothetical protein
MGALVGGMLESVSLWTGIRALLIFAALLYFFSFLFLRRGGKESSQQSNLEASKEAVT